MTYSESTNAPAKVEVRDEQFTTPDEILDNELRKTSDLLGKLLLVPKEEAEAVHRAHDHA